MKAPEVKDLISFIANTGLQEVNIQTSEIKLHIKRNIDSVAAPSLPQAEMRSIASATPATISSVAAPEIAPVIAKPEAEAKTVAPEVGEKEYVTVKSPMIGTFYRASGPGAKNFVEIGSTISKGQAVCIIEAMKLFNEIESEVSGTIVKVLVDNASPVEYDQPLFLVDPS